MPCQGFLRSAYCNALCAITMSWLAAPTSAHAAIADQLTIYTEHDPPYVSVDEQGKIGGLTQPRLARFLQAIQFPAQQIKIQPWVRAYKEAMSQPNVLIYPIAKTPEREAKLTFLYRLYDTNVNFYRLNERNDIQVNNLYAAKRYRVCAVRGDYRAEFLQQNGFPAIDLAPDSSTNLKKFIAGRCDLAILSEVGIKAKLAQLNEKPTRVRIAYPLPELDSNLYIAINSSSKPDILRQLKKAAASIQ